MSTRRRRFNMISRTCAASIFALSIGLSSAYAQDQNSAPGQMTEFSIPAQPLAKALLDFSNQANVDIVVPSDTVNGKASPGVTGHMTAEEALQTLLAGSGLKALSGEGGSLSIVPMSYLGGEGQAEKKFNAASGDKSSNSSPGDIEGSVSGHLSDHRTGANLGGALVRIVETGQTTQTDDRGNFRFPGVMPGDYVLAISYLGYANALSEFTLSDGEDFRRDFALSVLAGDMEELVVFGLRSARAMALNQERTSENSSSVVSSDLMGNFTGTTISEALRRVPGITFQRDEATGDGTNIIVRGMEPDMNMVKINGLVLPVTNGFSRSAGLGNILADSVEKITINKSLLPSHDSAGTGALVEIETKSPLSRPHRYANFSVEGGKKGKNFGNDLLISGTVAGTFGSEENFGLSASVQYRDSYVGQGSYSLSQRFGLYLPLDVDGSPLTSSANLNPSTPFPWEEGNDTAYVFSQGTETIDTYTSNLAMTLSAEWQIKGHTNLKIDYQHALLKTDTFEGRHTFNPFMFGRVMPVEALGGEERYAYYWSGRANPLHNVTAFVGDKVITDTVSFRGQSDFGKWTLKYKLGYAGGSNIRPNATGMSVHFTGGQTLDASWISAEATDPDEGRIISLFAPRAPGDFSYPRLLLSDLGWSVYGDPANYGVSYLSISSGGGSNQRYTAAFSARHDFGGNHLKYVEAGAQFESSRATSYGSVRAFSVAPATSLASLGMTFADLALARTGTPEQGFSTIQPADISNFANSLESTIASADGPFTERPSTTSPLYRDPFTRENNLAAYLQVRVDFGKLEIIAGPRLNRVALNGVNINYPSFTDENGVRDLVFREEFKKLFEGRGTTTDVVPRVLFNYRQNDNLVFRGGYFMSVARPSLRLLSGAQTLALDLRERNGPDGDQPYLRVIKPNPDLRPAITHNFDAGIEYYHDQIGVIKITAFYKQINNMFQGTSRILEEGSEELLAGIVLPDHPYFQDLPDNLYVTVTASRNSEFAARIWGIEGHIERQFTFLPGFWGGFGMFANYTFSDSSKHHIRTWRRSPVLDGDGNIIGRESVLLDTLTAFDQQPRHSGTAALTYNRNNIDATLAYTVQTRRKSSYRTSNLHFYYEDYSSLDFHIEYRFGVAGSNARIYLDASDLLKGPDDAGRKTTFGGTGITPKYNGSQTFYGGRAFKLGLAATF